MYLHFSSSVGKSRAVGSRCSEMTVVESVCVCVCVCARSCGHAYFCHQSSGKILLSTQLTNHRVLLFVPMYDIISLLNIPTGGLVCK